MGPALPRNVSAFPPFSGSWRVGLWFVAWLVAFAMVPFDRGVAAQAGDVSGTWKLNRSASRITAGIGIAGLGAGGAPNTLYIAQAANGIVTVGSDVNESQARTFRVAGGAIVSETPSVAERLTLSPDGHTLTITVAGQAGTDSTTTLVYTRTDVEAPCGEWPTPCRYDTGPRFRR